MTTVERNGLKADVGKDREWRQRSAERYEARRRARVEVTVKAGRTIVRRTPVNKQSADRRREAAVYRVRRVAFLEGKTCARCGTAHRLQLHHMAGRVGSLYLDESKWLPLCADCHTHVTEHPAEAIEQGYSLPRIGRAA